MGHKGASGRKKKNTKIWKSGFVQNEIVTIDNLASVTPSSLPAVRMLMSLSLLRKKFL